MKTVFLRVLEAEDKATALLSAVREPKPAHGRKRFDVNTNSFRLVPGAPFAYWVREQVRRLFVELEPLESSGRIARSTNGTTDDNRWIRAAWETPVVSEPALWTWVPHVKGGAFSPYYADPHLAIHWDRVRQTYPGYVGTVHRPDIRPASLQHFFLPGLTWPRRTNGLSFRLMSSGCIFGDKGPAIFVPDNLPENLLALCAIVNSASYRALVALQLARTELAQSFEAGLIQQTPVPPLGLREHSRLANLVRRAWSLKRSLDTQTETSHTFTLPALLRVVGTDVATRAAAWSKYVRTVEAELAAIQAEIDNRCFELYGINETDRPAITDGFGIEASEEASSDGEKDTEDDAGDDIDENESTGDAIGLAAELVSWAVGVAFGRFDVRLATGARPLPSEPKPFDPLPACSFGMLAGDDGLPNARPPADYPLAFPENGMLVDDPGHEQDLTATVRAVFDVVFGPDADLWWEDVAALLDLKGHDLRSWLAGSFFKHHLKRHSKSRRKAPIVWQLGTPSARYSVWLYAHRLTRDSIFQLQNEVVGSKLIHEERQLASLMQAAGDSPSASDRKVIAGQEAFIGELRAMLDEMTKGIVVWYDVRSEFAPFIGEVRGGVQLLYQPVPVSIAGISTHLAEYVGSMFELRALVEPLVNGDTPESVVIYLPGCERDRRASVLMDLEKAGECYEPQLRRLARNILRQRYTDGVIDEMLASDRVTYGDLARASSVSSSSEPPSILKDLFHDVTGNDDLLAAWLVSDARDKNIVAKEASRELRKLVRSRLGLDLPEDAVLAKMRAITLRHVLTGEFRNDLNCQPPACLEGIPSSKTKDEEAALRELVRRIRTSWPNEYPRLADQVEQEFGLAHAGIPGEALGSIDTFRFEERTLLKHCGALISEHKFDEAIRLVSEREHSFWLDRNVSRKAQWEAARRMAELGSVAHSTLAAISKAQADANTWVEAYAAPDRGDGGGWYRLDLVQRRLETWLANLDDEPDERPLAVARRAYDAVCQKMAEGFSRAIAQASWNLSRPLHQTRIYSEVVESSPKPVGYFLIDAMRFEMGVELSERLTMTSDVTIRAAIGSLPSITPIGMAALQPGASASFAVVEQGGKLGAKIEEAFLPDLAARKKFVAARVPKLVDLSLDQLLSLQPSRLTKRVVGAQVVVVRSQEIDHAGEAGFTFQAPQVMDTVIDNIARAIRKLATAGIEHCVVAADHGHLFLPSDRDESMRIDAPGGHTVELHRRCWIGCGGATPAGCVRVSATSLGYVSDLEFVFPVGPGVFKAGGDLAFHHGSASLQELVIPVLTVRTKTEQSGRAAASTITVSGSPPAVTNRIFSVTLQLGGQNRALFSTALVVRPLLMTAGKQVGSVGMASNAELDRSTGCVTLPTNTSVTVAFLLNDDTVASLRIVVQDPATDGVLYRSPADIPVRLGI